MNDIESTTPPARRRVLPLKSTVMLVATLTLILGNAGSMMANLDALQNGSQDIDATWNRIDKIRDLRRNIIDAETGQRGFMLTGKRSYLGPFDAARASYKGAIDSLARSVAGTPSAAYLESLAQLCAQKYTELTRTIALHEQGDMAAALAIVNDDRGKRLMDHIRSEVATMEGIERDRLQRRNGDVFLQFRRSSLIGLGIAAFTMAALLIFFVQIWRNVRLRENAESALRRANETLEQTVNQRTGQLSFLSRHLLKVSEVEKASLAAEIHDELGSNLTAINLDIASVMARLDKLEPTLAGKLRRAQGILRETVELKRRIIHGLRPSLLDSLGISAAMRTHCDDFTRRTGLPCQAECAEDIGEVDPAWSIALYRITQESLNNVSKYASAKNVHVTLIKEDKGIRLRISDDGVGIESSVAANPLSYGLLGMRERVAALGGVFVVRRGDGDRGTVVEAFIPFPGAVAAP